MVRKKLFSGLFFFLTFFCTSNTNSMEMLLSTAVLQHLPWITAGSVYVATVSYYKVKDMLRSKQMEEGFNEVHSQLNVLHEGQQNLKIEVRKLSGKNKALHKKTHEWLRDIQASNQREHEKTRLDNKNEHEINRKKLNELGFDLEHCKAYLERLKEMGEKNDISNDFITSALENISHQSEKNGQEIVDINKDLVKVKQLMQLQIGLTLEANPELKKKIHETFGDDLKLFFNSDKKQNEKNNKNTSKLSVANTNVQPLKNLLLPFSPNPEISVVHKFNFSGIKNNSTGGLKELLPN